MSAGEGKIVMKHKEQAGFTLLELVVFIVAVIILGAIIFFSTQRF